MGFLGQPLSFISIPPTRSFAGISGYVTLSESTTDVLTITKQPVQQGANISDHAYKEPVALVIPMRFERSLTQNLNTIYQSLLALQQPQATPASNLPNGIAGPVQLGALNLPTIQPFTVVTPKRTYYNMMLATLGCTTDKKTENVLAITCSFQEVIIVPVTTTVVPASQLSNPGSNLGTQNAGQKSALFTAFGPHT